MQKRWRRRPAMLVAAALLTMAMAAPMAADDGSDQSGNQADQQATAQPRDVSAGDNTADPQAGNDATDPSGGGNQADTSAPAASDASVASGAAGLVSPNGVEWTYGRRNRRLAGGGTPTQALGVEWTKD
jgi:hypothetical protein